MSSLLGSSSTSYPQRTSSSPKFSNAGATGSGRFSHVLVPQPSDSHMDVLSPSGIAVEQITRSDSGSIAFNQGYVARAVTGSVSFSFIPHKGNTNLFTQMLGKNKSKTILNIPLTDDSHKQYKVMTDSSGDLYINLGKVNMGGSDSYFRYCHVGIKIANNANKDALLSPQGDPYNPYFLKAITELIQNPDGLKNMILQNIRNEMEREGTNGIQGERSFEHEGLNIKIATFYQDVSNLRKMQNMETAVYGIPKQR